MFWGVNHTTVCRTFWSKYLKVFRSKACLTGKKNYMSLYKNIYIYKYITEENIPELALKSSGLINIWKTMWASDSALMNKYHTWLSVAIWLTAETIHDSRSSSSSSVWIKVTFRGNRNWMQDLFLGIFFYIFDASLNCTYNVYS